MSEVVKGPWPAEPPASRDRNKAEPSTTRKTLEAYWQKGFVQNPLHLNRPSIITGHEDSQPTLDLGQGELVTDGGVARANMLNFLKAVRKEESSK